MIRGYERKRERDGRYAIEQRCDACTMPIRGEHFTEDAVCEGSDGPGFFLCGRKRCGAKYENMTTDERRAYFTAGRKRGASMGGKAKSAARAPLNREQATREEMLGRILLSCEARELWSHEVMMDGGPAIVIETITAYHLSRTAEQIIVRRIQHGAAAGGIAIYTERGVPARWDDLAVWLFVGPEDQS